jgi:hypothetical protein
VERCREQFLIVNVAASSEAVIQGIVAKPRHDHALISTAPQPLTLNQEQTCFTSFL